MARLFNDITPLRVRSGYSLLRGTTRLAALVREAKALGQSRIALTDVNSLSGATAFWQRAIDAGLTPLLGAELRDPAGRSVTALVDSDAGYENLCQSISELRAMELEPEAATSAARPAVVAGNGWAPDGQAGMLPRPVSPLTDVLERFGEGLELLCDDAALLAELLAVGVDRRRLHPAIDPASQSRRQLNALRELIEERNLQPVASAPSLTLGARHAEAARLLAAIRLRTTIGRVPPDELPHPRAHLRDPDTLGRQLADWPEAIEGNARIAKRCSRFRLLPREPVFPAFPTPDGSPPADFLRKLCREGIARRYDDFPSEAVHERLQRELGLIEQLGFVEYFLVVWDIVQYARRRGAPVAGRGSGGSSIVAYLLGITNVCPIRYDIPFERFIHARREDFPDLDVDFCWRLRDEVIEYAFDRWGRDCTAMVSMHTTFQPRSAFRQAGKALGFSDDQLSRLAGRDGSTGRNQADQPAVSRIAKLAQSIRELPHVLSVHPGGIVIAPRGIRRQVPIERATKGVMITQMDKNGVEDMRLVKLDLLGNRNLSTVRYACDRIAERHGAAPDIEALPPADPATIERLRRGDTVGCNQLESPAMRHLLTMMQPSEVGDVMKALALIRPGAASIGMKEVFIRRLRGLEDTPPTPPQLAGVLDDTCGVMLYEDDVMLTAAAMLSCSLSQADRFRKQVQKCTSDAQRRELSREFLAGCVRNGIDPDYARDTWVQMAKFNHYSFCRAHAGSYAMLAYAGAYLRTHWPREFWLAALNNNQSMYHPRVYVEQAKREGVAFRLPSVNHSGEEFALEADGTIRVGLQLVSGLGPVTIERILQRRQRRAFDGLTDLLWRVGLGESEARSLILCGALDWTGRSRPTLMMEWTLYRTMKPGRVPGGPLLSAAPVVPDAPGDYDEARKYFDEREILGISVREHILSLYRPTLARLVNVDTRALPHRLGQRVRIAGVLEARRATRTQGGETMLFLTLEDEYGMFEATVFPSAMRAMRTKLAGAGPYRITGRVDSQHGCVSVTADTIERIRVTGVDPR